MIELNTIVEGGVETKSLLSHCSGFHGLPSFVLQNPPGKQQILCHHGYVSQAFRYDSGSQHHHAWFWGHFLTFAFALSCDLLDDAHIHPQLNVSFRQGLKQVCLFAASKEQASTGSPCP